MTPENRSAEGRTIRRRAVGRENEPRRPAARTAGRTVGRDLSTGGTVVLCLAAAALTAVFFVQMLRPAGFLGAVRQADYARLLLADDAANGGAGNGSASWTQIYGAYRQRLRSLPFIRRHVAVRDLLRLVLDVADGRRSADEAVRLAESLPAEYDENPLIPLARAVLIDTAADSGALTDNAQFDDGANAARGASSRPAGPDAMVRYERMQAALGAAPPTASASLSNAALQRVWRDTLKDHVSRRDVAASLAVGMNYFQTTEHFRALPIIHRRMAGLIRSLESAGRLEEANALRRRLADVYRGLIEAEPDYGTQLLCVDLLRDLMPPGSVVANSLERLHDDFRTAASSAPPDLTDLNKLPSIDAAAYRLALLSLTTAATFAIAAIGAAFFIPLGAVVGMIARLLRRRAAAAGPSIESSGAEDRGAWYRSAFSLGPCVIVAVLIDFHLRNGRVFSEAWAHAAAILACGVGALCALAGCSLRSTRSNAGVAGRPRFSATPPVFAAAMAILVALPPRIVAGWLQAADRVLPSLRAVAVISVLAIIAATWATRPSVRALARSAARSWCILMAAALVVMQVHTVFDAQHQSATAAGRSNELAARLGDEWKLRYLMWDCPAYDPSQP